MNEIPPRENKYEMNEVDQEDFNEVFKREGAKEGRLG